MKKLLIAALLTGITTGVVNSQENILATDVLNFSKTNTWGTARSLGLNGAYGSLGADIASMGINPAGLGFYRTSDLSLSLGGNTNYAHSNYLGNKYDDFKTNYNLGNIGFVYTSNTLAEEGWVSFSFGASFTRISDFNRSVTIKNPNASSSLLDDFNHNANTNYSPTPSGSPVSDPSTLDYYYEYLAVDHKLMLQDPKNYNYFSDYTNAYNTYGEYMERRIDISGGVGEWNLSFGANYSNKLYLGASLGLDNLTYNEESKHTEITPQSVSVLRQFTFGTVAKMTGSGANLKIGAIFKPVSFLRFGLAIHTPTYYSLNTEFHT